MIQYTLNENMDAKEQFFTDTSDNVRTMLGFTYPFIDPIGFLQSPVVNKGRKRRVSQDNKIEYLQHLSVYRLMKRPKEQIKHFQKGEVSGNFYLLSQLTHFRAHRNHSSFFATNVYSQ